MNQQESAAGIVSSSRARSLFFENRLALILVVGIFVRFLVVIWADIDAERFDYPDAQRYMRVAINFADGRGLVESETIKSGTDPLYPLVLSLRVGSAASDGLLENRARFLNLIFACLSILIVADLGRRLFKDKVGLIAALIFAIDPIQVFFCGLVLTETMYTFLLLSAALCIVCLNGKNSLSCAFGCGVLMGLATLTRSSHLLLSIPMLVMIALWSPGNWRKRVGYVVVSAVALAVTISPNVIRNYRLFDTLVLTRSGSGASMMEGLGPWADGGPGMDRIVYPEFSAVANEIEKDQACREAAMSWAKEHPARALSLAWTKLLRTWSPTINAPGYDRPLYTAVGWLTTMPVFVLIVIGAWRVRRDWRAWSLLIAPAAYYTLVHMVFVGSVRYRVPAMPMLFVLAGAGAAALLERIRRRHAPQGD